MWVLFRGNYNQAGALKQERLPWKTGIGLLAFHREQGEGFWNSVHLAALDLIELTGVLRTEAYQLLAAHGLDSQVLQREANRLPKRIGSLRNVLPE